MWGIGFLTIGLGIWRMMYGIRKLKWAFGTIESFISEMDQERCNVRITLSPFLQAEEDIR